MLIRNIRFRFFLIPIGGILFCIIILLPFVNAQTQYPKTISVLEAAYNGEIQAFHSYMAYAENANSENYTNIAKLFVALAASEAIHAHNFKTLLSELGVEVTGSRKIQVEASDTKENLNKATKVELQEIDTKYPQFIKKIESEKHEEAIRNITYAWESEKQHRELIRKIQSGTGMFFGILSKKIEETPMEYFVCQNCGSTLRELPQDNCPICKLSVLNYKKIQ